jgi:hypothetical protein
VVVIRSSQGWEKTWEEARYERFQSGKRRADESGVDLNTRPDRNADVVPSWIGCLSGYVEGVEAEDRNDADTG